MTVDVAEFVERKYGKVTELEHSRGTRRFQINKSDETVIVQFGSRYRDLGIRVDVHRADPELPLEDGDHHIFVCTARPEEVMLCVDRKRLLKMIKEGTLRKDNVNSKHYVSLADVELV